MKKQIIMPAKASLILAIVGIFAGVSFQGRQPAHTASPFDQGAAEGRAIMAMLVFLAGIVAAVIAMRGVQQQKLSNTNFYASLAGLALNFAGLGFVLIPFIVQLKGS